MAELPTETIDEVVRLTRLARRATDANEAAAYRDERDSLLADHGFVARVREEDTRDVLVLHPTEWIEDETVRTDRIDDLTRAVELPLGGTGDEDDWAAVDAHNRSLVAAVEDAAGPVHAANASAFADFMSNHYVRPMESATETEVGEFLEWYFPRNTWPTAEQTAVIEDSLRLAFEEAGRRPPASLAPE